MQSTYLRKQLLVETAGLSWPLTPKRIEQRENRTLLREHDDFRDSTELRQYMISHDIRVLAKWVQRGLVRQKAVLVNSPNVTIRGDIVADRFEVYITQKAIRFDPDLYRQYEGWVLMLPEGLRVFEFAVPNEDLLRSWAHG